MKLLVLELYDELSAELATKEFVGAEMGPVRAKFKHHAFLLKILIGITIFGLTLFSHAFITIDGTKT